MDKQTPSVSPSRRTAGLKPTSLKDIAAQAGVSYSLVSKVLRGRMGNAGVREEVREKIVRIAAEMNYRPHSLASDLKRGRKGAVGVLLHPVGERGSGILEDFLRSVASGLDQRGLRMWMTFFEFDEELIDHLNMRMRHDIDALIVAGVPHPSTDALIKELHASGLPVVTMLEESPIESIPNIAQDRFMQGYLPTKHLLEQGCRRIAHMNYGNSPSRHLGFLEAHKDADVPVVSELEYRFDYFSAAEGAAAVEQLLAKGLSFDAIVAQSDQQAWGVITALQRRGLRVPEDVRVTGMDNSVLAEISTVPITSVSTEMSTVGKRVVEMLADVLEGGMPASERIPVRLHVRASA